MNAQNHYEKPALLQSILSKLRHLGYDESNITRSILSNFDEFHLQGAAITKNLAEKLSINTNHKILDVGCGIGGAVRMFAAIYNCEVTGLDYTKSYIETAIALSKIVGLDQNTTFIHGSALELPFTNNSFDFVWTQHAQMNIENKAQMYAEIKRVLKPGGQFIYYDIFTGNNSPVHFPVPWAEVPENSFLMSHVELGKHFTSDQFKLIFSENHSQNAIEALQKARAKAQSGEGPKANLQLLMGASMKDKMKNLLQGLIEKKVEVFAGSYLKF